MSNSGEDRPFVASFMDDYFAEADEHMLVVRRSLLSLEAALGSAQPAGVLEELFRSFHSLKGISAMVELHEAELLAHHMESCLRAVRQGTLWLDSANFEILVDGVRVLEHVIAARRASLPLPSIEPILERLETLAQTGAGASNADTRAIGDAHRPASAAGRAHTHRWRVTFVPSPQLVERGVKVDTVRARLLEFGQVLSVTPKVVPGGGISFDFDLHTTSDTLPEQWQEDGLSYEPLDAAAPQPSASVGEGLLTERPLLDLTGGSSNVVRVDLGRLDDLMRLVGEMVVTRSRLDDTLRRVESYVPFQEWRALQDHSARIERNLRDLREGVMRVRLVSVGEIFRRMPFVVRDLARDNGKRVHLELAGHGAEIDKFLVERMMDPVLHLVRNAISHGIETPEQRIAAGKPADGTIRLGAVTAGETVIIDIADDGAGIDIESVTQRAAALGVLPQGELDSRALLDIICASGFSTRAEADRASGRGVGMAVVRDTVEALGGALTVETRPGRGTTFRMTLPLTLAITDAIVAHVGDQIFAVPQAAVREVVEVDAGLLRAFEHNELMPHRGGALPMLRLSDLFSLPVTPRLRYHAIVIGTGQAAVGLLVDRIAGQREVVVKAITDPLIRVDGVSGATELGDGRVVLILDVVALSRIRRQHPRVITGVSA